MSTLKRTVTPRRKGHWLFERLVLLKSLSYICFPKNKNNYSYTILTHSWVLVILNCLNCKNSHASFAGKICDCGYWQQRMFCVLWVLFGSLRVNMQAKALRSSVSKETSDWKTSLIRTPLRRYNVNVKENSLASGKKHFSATATTTTTTRRKRLMGERKIQLCFRQRKRKIAKLQSSRGSSQV